MAISANTTVMRTTRGTGRYRQLVACFMPAAGACCPASTCGSLVIICSWRESTMRSSDGTLSLYNAVAQGQSLLLLH